MIGFIGGFVLAAVLAYGISRVRAKNKGDSVLSVVHGDLAHRLDTIEAKFDALLHKSQ